MESKENKHFMDKVADALRKAATELEEFQVKAALGKKEAEGKYEEMKKKMNSFIQDSKSTIDAGKEKIEEIKPLFEHLRVQLSLGKAETIEIFKEQKKKIEVAIHELEVKIKSNEKVKKAYAYMLIELEKFKAQLQFLLKKFEEGKDVAKESFEKGKKEFDAFVNQLKGKIVDKDAGKWDHFQEEISEAFGHFKNAFSKAN